ncbi:MAG TPA: hypothetical protein VHB46_11040 [Burkholderiales bacterium]|nr:hypothetical protein [Burkholderiales bacterium]
MTTSYPTQSELLNCLVAIANDAGDTTQLPFRVDVIPLNGKPPMYSIMIKSPAKDLMRRQIGQLLGRNFALGATSFMISGSEAMSLVNKQPSTSQAGQS